MEIRFLTWTEFHVKMNNGGCTCSREIFFFNLTWNFIKKNFTSDKSKQQNWVCATNSAFITPISLQPDVVNTWSFKLWIMLDQKVCLKCTRFRPPSYKEIRIRNLSLWQKLSSFKRAIPFTMFQTMHKA